MDEHRDGNIGCNVAIWPQAREAMIDKHQMRSNQTLARAACLIGGVFDGLTLLPMLLPNFGGTLFDIQGFFPGPDYRYAMNLAASLMLGWTLLLFWASKHPMEYAGVLMLTAVVVFCLMLAGSRAVLSGFISLRRMLPVFALQFGLLILFLVGYLQVSRLSQGSRLDSENQDEIRKEGE